MVMNGKTSTIQYGKNRTVAKQGNALHKHLLTWAAHLTLYKTIKFKTCPN